jgi:hypothetical protein
MDNPFLIKKQGMSLLCYDSVRLDDAGKIARVEGGSTLRQLPPFDQMVMLQKRLQTRGSKSHTHTHTHTHTKSIAAAGLELVNALNASSTL